MEGAEGRGLTAGGRGLDSLNLEAPLKTVKLELG